MTKHTAMAIAVLLGFGVLRRPLERSIEQDLQDHEFRAGMALPDQSAREQLGQLGVAAALGGFRSFLATAFELRAFTAWYEADYEAVDVFYNLATQLQPRESGYWEMAAWMMESNAASQYQEEVPGESSFERRRRLTQVPLARARGKKYLEDGLKFNPDDFVLNRALAIFYKRREGDFCQAAEYFARAAATRNGTAQTKRLAAFSLAMCPGKEAEAYSQLLGLRDEMLAQHGHYLPTFVVHCQYLEHILNIPEAERVPIRFNLEAFHEILVRYPPVTKEGRIRLQRIESLLRILKEQRISG